MQKNNLINISGQVINIQTKNYKLNKEIFYMFYIKTKRLSETYDTLPVIIPKKICDFNLLQENQFINIKGEIRTYNNSELNFKLNNTKLILVIYAQNIFFFFLNNHNQVFLTGHLCKNPTYRKTPFGREISDILLKIKRSDNKLDYIPCISWGKNARRALKFNLSDKIKIHGRIQSREYQKKIITGETLNKTTYEVSVFKINSD